MLLTSLDVKGVFDSAWWPAILTQLQKLYCPSNLYLHSALVSTLGQFITLLLYFITSCGTVI